MLVLHDDAITQNVFASFPSYVGAPGPSSCVRSKAFPSCLAVFLQANLVPPSTPIPAHGKRHLPAQTLVWHWGDTVQGSSGCGPSLWVRVAAGTLLSLLVTCPPA